MKNQDKCLYLIKSNIEKEISRGLHYCDILDTIENKPCLRTYCYKYTKAKGLQIKEMGREFIDYTYISDDFYYSSLGGYQMIFDNEKKTRCYYTYEAKGTISKTNACWYPNVYRKPLYTIKEAEELFASEVPYLKINGNVENGQLIPTLRAFKKNHKCEMLVKFGFPYLTKYEKAISKMKHDTSKKFVKWLSENKEFIYTYLPNYKFITSAIRTNMSGYDYNYYLRSNEMKNRLDGVEIKVELNVALEIVKFIEKQGCDITTYVDYMRISKQLRRNVLDRGVMFPRDIIAQHDNLQLRIDKKANRKINKVFKKIIPYLSKYALSYKGLQIVIPKSQEDLVKLGNELHNCVGTYGYGEKMSLGDCIILAIYKNGKPVECCELTKPDDKLQINQLYGDHNQYSNEHENAEKLVGKFLKAYKPMNLIGACI